MRMLRGMFTMLVLCLGLLSMGPANLWAKSAKEIDAGVEETLKRFDNDIKNGKDLIKSAKGVLVFPSVIKAGLGLGGEYGEGALLINNKAVDYYSTAAGSIGFQLGVQKKSILLLFTDKSALEKFQNSSGWKAGVDASVAVISIGAGGDIDTAKLNQPIVAFVFDQKGLMYNLTLEGAKFSKLNRK